MEHEKIELKEKMKSSYLNYSINVITERALPDLRDGLKPVQRRDLYAAYKLGLSSDNAYKKSAQLVGSVMGDYHPHGDSAIYSSIVKMAQPFLTRYPLFDGQGNWGSIDGDSAAAQRYTEVKLTKTGDMLLKGVDTGIVPMKQTYTNDGTMEPVVLPSKLPNILLNETYGVAVGMSTAMPPHNAKEVANVIKMLIKNEKCTIDDILTVMQGPDFPTGGIISDTTGIRQYFETGKGKIVIDSKWHYTKKPKEQIVNITEIPYKVNKSTLVEKLSGFIIKDNKEEGLLSVEDHSNINGINISLTFTKRANVKDLMEYLSKKTPMRSSYNVSNIVLDKNGYPKQMNILEIISEYIDFQFEVYTNESKNIIKKINRQIEIAETLIKAVSQVKRLIKIIEESDDEKEMKEKIKKLLSISDEMVNYILEIKLKRIQKIEKVKEEAELNKLKAIKEEHQARLLDKNYMLDAIVKEIEEMVNIIDDGRKTFIGDINGGSMVSKKLSIGYNKDKVEIIKDQTTKDLKEFKNIVTASVNSDSVIIFRNGLTKLVSNSFIESEEVVDDIVSVIPLESKEDKLIYIFTKNGIYKAIDYNKYIDVIYKKKEIGIIALDNNDEIVDAFLGSEGINCIGIADNGKFIHADISDTRATGLQARGNIFMSLKGNEHVVRVHSAEGKDMLMFYGAKKDKLVKIEDINTQKRAGQGRKLGNFTGILPVKASDKIIKAKDYYTYNK